MKVSHPAAALSAVILAGSCFLTGCSRTEAAISQNEQIAHGRYIVHGVGMCIDCHSPRNERGEFVEAQHLMGSALPFAPTVPMPWANAAPGIAGFPAGYSEGDLINFLMTGQRPHGKPHAAPPMPEYRMSRADAEAVTAYLRSLRTTNQ
jgi:hypothetical protein